MGKVKVYIENRQKDVKIPTGLRLLIRRSCAATLAYEHFPSDCEVSVSIINDEEIRRLNAQFRNRDIETDVLSFPLGENGQYDVNPANGFAMLGDVVISMNRVISQAEAHGHSLEREAAYLTVHSVLHLLGYDHQNEQDKPIMREKEEAILESLGLSRL